MPDAGGEVVQLVAATRRSPGGTTGGRGTTTAVRRPARPPPQSACRARRMALPWTGLSTWRAILDRSATRRSCSGMDRGGGHGRCAARRVRRRHRPPSPAAPPLPRRAPRHVGRPPRPRAGRRASTVADLGAVTMAAFFHDAVYDPRGGDNEEQSAALAERVLAELGWPAGRARPRRHPGPGHRSTTRPPTIPTAAVLLDADLAVLGSEPAAYQAYVTGVRAEYAPRRRRGLARRPRAPCCADSSTGDRLYCTAAAAARWEARAGRQHDGRAGQPLTSPGAPAGRSALAGGGRPPNPDRDQRGRRGRRRPRPRRSGSGVSVAAITGQCTGARPRATISRARARRR